ncbi:MAG: tyrosine-type recombinase/integrase [Firmicutes bacterium]|nr:tyrosine-type recombinase/integrase [Bacillota bacterium]
MGDYYKTRKENNLERLHNIKTELPLFVSEFFMGIESRTSPLTRLNYAYDLRDFLAFLSESKYDGKSVKKISVADLDDLTASDIELYMDYISYRKDINGTVRACGERAKMRHLCAVRSLLKYFFNKDKIKANVASKVALPKLHDKEIIRLDMSEVRQLLELAENGDKLTVKQKQYHEKNKLRDAALLMLFLGTGIRISELVGLNIEHIDFRKQAFKVTRKGGAEAVLYFSDEVAESLKTYSGHRAMVLKDAGISNPAFFLTNFGRISTRAVQELVKKYSRIVSPLKKISPHKLRSTFGTELYKSTRDIYVVAEVLGHRDVNTTKKHYAALSEEIRKDASTKIRLHDD